MKKLISSKDNSIEPRGAIGKQKCGIIFWQESTLFRHCSKQKLKLIIKLIDRKYSPTEIIKGPWWYIIKFDSNEQKVVFLTVKKKPFRYSLYGESYTAYVDADFHIFVLELINYISTELGCKIFVDDSTGYLEHRSVKKLKEYIDNLEIVSHPSPDLLRQAIIKKQNSDKRN